MNNLYPLKKSNAMILQNFQLKYTMTASNQINNDLGFIATVRMEQSTIALVHLICKTFPFI